MENYQLLNHTADFGIRVTGRDARTLFENAGLALLDLVCESTAGIPDRRIEIQVDGADWPDLMVNWLREILYLWTGRELLGTSVRIRRLSENFLSAEIACAPYDPSVHALRNEIKAVTYHQIKVTEQENGWSAQVIFDI